MMKYTIVEAKALRTAEGGWVPEFLHIFAIVPQSLKFNCRIFRKFNLCLPTT